MYKILVKSRQSMWSWNMLLNLVEQGKLEEAKLFELKKFEDLEKYWLILIVTPEYIERKNKDWEKIHLNHGPGVLMCSDPRCPKNIKVYDEHFEI